MDDILFDAHVENLKRELNVDPRVVVGEAAIEETKEYGALFHGGYIWEIDLVALPDKSQIWNLAHEMRHSWQCKNREKENYIFRSVKNKPWIIKKLMRAFYLFYYSFDRKELDANKFAQEYCMKTGLQDEALKVEKLLKGNKMAKIIIILLHPLILFMAYSIYRLFK